MHTHRTRKAFTQAALALAAVGALALFGSLGFHPGLAQNSEDEVVEIALIHSLTVGAGEDFPASSIFPGEVHVKVGQRVRLFNVSPDPAGLVHGPIVISEDEDGQSPVFGVSFRVEPGHITVVEFTPDRPGTFFITHRPHGHNIVGRLVVEADG